jgi:hypothetical protein
MQKDKNVAQTPQQTEFYIGETPSEPVPEPRANPDKYLVYPEDDGYDGPKNPFSTV